MHLLVTLFKHKTYSYIVFFKFLFYSYVHIMFDSFLPPSHHTLPYPTPTPSLTPPPYHWLPGRNDSALIFNFVEERV
jgi:hypothetical protein